MKDMIFGATLLLCWAMAMDRKELKKKIKELENTNVTRLSKEEAEEFVKYVLNKDKEDNQ